jgi:hypothetical protein
MLSAFTILTPWWICDGLYHSDAWLQCSTQIERLIRPRLFCMPGKKFSGSWFRLILTRVQAAGKISRRARNDRLRVAVIPNPSAAHRINSERDLADLNRHDNAALIDSNHRLRVVSADDFQPAHETTEG